MELHAIAPLIGKEVQVITFIIGRGAIILEKVTLEDADRCYVRLKGSDGKTTCLPHQVIQNIALQSDVPKTTVIKPKLIT